MFDKYIYKVIKINVGAPGAPEGGRGEQPRLRGEREGAGPGVRVRGGHIVPAEPGVAAPNAAGGGAGGDRLHPDAARP